MDFSISDHQVNDSNTDKICCQLISLQYTCGHKDDKFVRYTQSGKRYREQYDLGTPSNPEYEFQMQMAAQLDGGATPMPHVKAAMAMPGFNFGSSTSSNSSDDSQTGKDLQPSEVKTSIDDTTAPDPSDPYVPHGNHPKCGLFEHNQVKVTRECPACTRRNMSRAAYHRVQMLKHELTRARQGRWSRTSIDHIEKKLAEAEDLTDFTVCISQGCFPFVEPEDNYQEDDEVAEQIFTMQA